MRWKWIVVLIAVGGFAVVVFRFVRRSVSKGIQVEIPLHHKESNSLLHHHNNKESPHQKESLSLTRLASHGVEFYDHWRPIDPHLIPESLQDQIFQGFGSPLLNPHTCQSNIPNRPAIATRFAYHGLGQNLLQLANYMLHTGLGHTNTFFFLAFNDSQNHDHAFQNWFQTHFSLVHSPGTTCFVFDTYCQNEKHRCYDAFWEEKHGGADMWQAATWHVDNYRLNFPREHNALKTLLLRELLRLTVDTKTMLDEDVTVNYSSDEAALKQVTMHIRRTDKITGEAKLVPCSVFVRALEMVVSNKDSSSWLLHLLSDEEQVQHEFALAFQHSPIRHRVKVNFRFARNRPDQSDSVIVHKAFLQLLVDLRLMVDADVFIGSQSSNLGVVACLLRVHHECFTVEQPFPFTWNPDKDKIA